MGSGPVDQIDRAEQTAGPTWQKVNFSSWIFDLDFYRVFICQVCHPFLSQELPCARRQLAEQGGLTEQQANAILNQEMEAARREYAAQTLEYARLEAQLAALGGQGGGHMVNAIDRSLHDHRYQYRKRGTSRFIGVADERRHRGSGSRGGTANHGPDSQQ